MVRIVLADDHRLMREGLRGLLDEMDGFQVVGQADDGRTAVRLARELTPDLVIIDVTMPELNGIEATRQIVAESPGTRVIALSMHADSRVVTEMFKAGARGYVLKDSAVADLCRAVESVLANGYYLSPSLTSIIVDSYLNGRAGETRQSVFDLLTAREREVLQLVAEGCSTKEIADRLFISTKTVEKHRQQLTERLNARNIADLTRMAVREGLVPLEE